MQMLEDEEARQRLMVIIIAPAASLVILVSAVEYMFTLPFASLSDYFGVNVDIAQDFLDENGSEFDFGELMNDNAYVLGDYSQYDAFDAELFAQLMDEAQKHIGKPYRMGANGPDTFDCSSFVAWAYRVSGVYHMPRTTAQGIYNQTVPIPRSEAKAGDLVFFQGTYDTQDSRVVTHVGIYLNDGRMLHAGRPIGFANIDTAYWQNHMYGFGRLPILPNE